jgi:hypothetical protein
MGLPIGGDLEYADEVTMAKALENRELWLSGLAPRLIGKRKLDITISIPTTFVMWPLPVRSSASSMCQVPGKSSYRLRPRFLDHSELLPTTRGATCQSLTLPAALVNLGAGDLNISEISFRRVSVSFTSTSSA